MKRYLAFFLFAMGIFFISRAFGGYLQPLHTSLVKNISTTKLVFANEVPTEIVIPSLSIKVKISPSKVVNGYWQLSDTTASFALGTALPGNAGNTVIFAHARPGLFQNLPYIVRKAIVYVKTKNSIYTYVVRNTLITSPTNTSVFTQTNNKKLTLYTCTGFFYTKRFVATAQMVNQQ